MKIFILPVPTNAVLMNFCMAAGCWMHAMNKYWELGSVG